MDIPKISAIIPVYKVEKYIQKCVDSVLNQTYRNIEVILVDDGSPDNCPKICDEYAQKDERVRVFHKENGGQSSARNLALDNIEGEYVCFVDSDDYIECFMIEKMLKQLERENGDVAICLEKRDNEKLFEKDIYKNILEDKIGSQIWRYLFKSESFQGGGIRFPVGRFAEDIAVLDRILYQKKIVYVSERFYSYFFNNQENSSNTPQNIYKNTVDRAIAFSGRYDWMKDKSDIAIESKNIVLSKAANFILATFCRYKNNNYNRSDINYLYQFLKENKKKIKSLKELSMARRIAIRLLLAFPRLFSTVGAVTVKRKRLK